MPIVGESATLYFQDEIDAAPIVTGCVRKNGSTCAMLSDTANRYFATESGNYLDMLAGAISFHRSGLNVNLNDKNGITLSSSGNLSIGASGSVNLSAGSVSINATSKLLVQKSKSSYISLENEFDAKASAVYENGSDRQSNPKFTDDEPAAGVAQALAKRKAEQAKQNKENLKFNNGNLLLAMSGVKATLVQTPTLNGSIMGSVGLSQTNNSGESYIVLATKNTRPITIFESLQIDRGNAPGEYKLDYIFKAFGAWFESGKSYYFTTVALADGMQPEYANLYGDFTMGMGLESLATISITGLKSVSGLSKGYTSGDDIIVGSGAGNVYQRGSKPVSYGRPSGFRKGVKDQVWEKAKGEDGLVRDPLTDEIMTKDEAWDMGHKPGYEFRKHKESAQERAISRKQFLDKHNNPDHYRPELPSSNRSHQGEDITDQYFGP